MINYNDFKKLLYAISGEPECEIHFNNTDDTYIIIKYNDFVTFQKCSDEQDRGEFEYKTLDELYNSILVDEICLKNDWKDIKDIIINSTFSVVYDKDEIRNVYNVDLK